MQDFEDMEILCVDDGSTDGSRAILERFAAKEPRMQICPYEKNRGQAFARNRGMEQARGEYVFFLDSDDMIPEGTLSRVYDMASKSQLDVVWFGFVRVDEHGCRFSQHSFFPEPDLAYEIETGAQKIEKIWKQGVEFTAWTCLWNRHFLARYSLFFHEGILHEDIPFAVQALLSARRVQFLPEVCYLYRRRPGSTMTTPFGWENLRGDLLGTADIVQFLLQNGDDLPEGSVRTGCWFLMRMQSSTHQFIEQLGMLNVPPEDMECVAEEMAYRLAMQNGKHYVRGYLTQEERTRLRAEDDIIIYGVGRIGREVMEVLEEYGIQNYHLAVTKMRKQKAHGLMEIVHELREYYDLRETALVILAVGIQFRTEMRREAERLGFERIVDYFDLSLT